jgi:cysteine synthase
LVLTMTFTVTVPAREMQVLHLKCLVTVGLAAASAARILGKKATICVTNNTPQNILDRLKAEGAEVRQIGTFWSDADDLCRKLVAADPNGVLPLHKESKDSYIVHLLITRMLLTGMLPWRMKLSNR